MSASYDPVRLADAGSEAPETLRRALAACQADVGTAEELGSLEVRLATLLWVPGAPLAAGAAGGGAAATTGVLAKLGVAAVTAAAVGGAVWLSASHRAVEPVSPAEAPVGATAPAEANDSRPAVTGGALEAMRRDPGSRDSVGRSLPPATPSEAELLGQAQSAVGANPSKALALAEQHARRFPRGMLTQEREVIAVEALARMGRASEASARADRFLQRFPGSAYRSKISMYTVRR